jgi:hypothetical protein
MPAVRCRRIGTVAISERIEAWVRSLPWDFHLGSTSIHAPIRFGAQPRILAWLVFPPTRLMFEVHQKANGA